MNLRYMFITLLLVVIGMSITFGVLYRRNTVPAGKPPPAKINNVLGEQEEVVVTSPILPSPTSGREVYWGLWTQGFWDEATKTLHPERLREMEAQVGKKAAIAHYYRGWDALGDSLVPELTLITSNGWRPMVSANPYFFDGCSGGGMTLYRAIAGGNCDEFLHAVGRSFKAYGKPVFFRFAWEMNIPSMSWSVLSTGDSPEDFKNAWARFRQITLEEGATNVLWVFSPHIATPQSVPISALYPGDAFVDWVALDGYNWGTTQSWSSWQSFSAVFSDSYGEITRIAPTKPVMIAEVNSTDAGGDKGAWYRDMLTVQIPALARIRAVVFYDEDRTAPENVNWRIGVNQDSLEAFRQAIASPTYRSVF